MSTTPNSGAMLRAFVEFVWDDNCCEYTLSDDELARDWVLRRGTVVYGKYWFFKQLLEVPCVYEAMCLDNVDISLRNKVKNDILYHEDVQMTVQMRLTYRLRYLLPILVYCKDNVNYTDAEGQTALHLFFRYYVQDAMQPSKMSKVLRLVKRMIQLGLSIDQMDIRKHTPLHVAIKLKTYRANLIGEVAVNRPWLLVSYTTGKLAYDADWLTILDLLLPHLPDVNAQDSDGYSLLHYAVKYGAINIAWKLLKLGADVNCRTRDKRLTPLHFIPDAKKFYRPYQDSHWFGADYMNDIELLLHAGADINAQSVDRVTPLFEIVIRGSVEDVKLMIQRGADFWHQDKTYEFTPFHFATHDSSMFRFMLERTPSYVDVHSQSKHGISTLHVAAIVGNAHVVDMLIQLGASIDGCTERYELTALHFAAINDESIAKLTSLLGVVGRTSSISELWQCLRFSQDRSNLIDLLVNAGADIDAEDIFGRTPLFLASQCPKSSAIPTLLRYGADLDVDDYKGRLPIHNVIYHQNTEGFQHLLIFGANINNAAVADRILNYNGGEIQHEALKHIVHLQAADIPVYEAYLPHLDSQIYAVHFRNCADEVQRLKTCMINNTLSFYHLVNGSLRKQFLLTDKKPVPGSNFLIHFPRYCGIIRGIYRETRKKALLMNEAKAAWNYQTRIYLPDICLEHILTYCTSRDMKRLITGR